ncbi:vwkA [Symbiodinium sp. CCMP2592]|nr:vwkA [Symbiodinium sp. CCMP2592]
MALKSLAALPEATRGTKLPAVKAGILKRLLSQAQKDLPKPVEVQQVHTPPPMPPTSMPPDLDAFGDEELQKLRCGLRRPPTELPPPQDGVETLGDEPWFADPTVRLALRDAVDVAHAEFKILVGDPAEEIARICPRDGRSLRAGAVLRLGGSHLGGYGDADVAYAFRQLSRALHPDKNPDNADAGDAFKRLKEAQEELKISLEDARALIRRLAAPFRFASVGEEEMRRPQAALFAEATRLVASVLALSTEGVVPAATRQHAQASLRLLPGEGGGWALPSAGAEPFVEAWLSSSADLLQMLAEPSIRSAYDCAPKRYRAQFLVLLARCALFEAEKTGGCVRQAWGKIWESFPEIQLWQQLRQMLVKKCQVHGRQPKRDASGAIKEKDWSTWSKRWRKIIRAVLPNGDAEAAPWSDAELRKLCAALWRDFADPLEKGDGAEAETARRCFGLFRTESRGAADVAAQRGAAPAEWAFVPAADLLLVVGEGAVGVTVAGVSADGDGKRLPFATAIFQTMM